MIKILIRKAKVMRVLAIFIMSLGMDSLHSVLKDKTRRKIILLLDEKSSLSYVDLMKALGIGNTGKMNYHLKVLGNLLSKDETGRYTLTEKGKLAVRLLREFPEDDMQEYKRWVPAILTVYVTVILTMAFLTFNPQYIQQFFLTTLVAVAIGLILLALLTWNQKFRARFQRLLTNRYARTQKPFWKLPRKALLSSAILLTSILAFLTLYYYYPSLINGSPYFVYLFAALLMAFLISLLAISVSLLKRALRMGARAAEKS